MNPLTRAAEDAEHFGERRALHDVIAGTAVVYPWDARAQRLRFLARGDLGG